MGRTKGTYTLTSNIEPKVGAPLDARTIVKLLADLTASNTFEYPYKGMKVFVEENNKSYTLVGSDPTVSANWIEDNSGGHTIKNPADTAMTQRSNLQFVDLTVSDDSTNDATKVESVHVIQSESELDNLPDGLYMLDDEEDTIIDSDLVGYDNTDSGLEATNVKDAIDELAQGGGGGGTVTDVKVNDVSVVDQYGAANIDLTGYAEKTDLGTASELDVAASGDASISQVVKGDDTRLTNARPASDVSSWAKASTKPEYTASEVGAIATTAKGTANGVAELDENGKVPSAQLPSYVDDVLEYASVSVFPATGESGKIYIALDTNKTYRWSGTGYAEISESLALGETSSTAYVGNKGKANADNIATIQGLIPSTATTSNKLITASDINSKLNATTLASEYETEATTTATKAHAKDSKFYLAATQQYCMATTDIAIGDTLVENTNYVAITINGFLTDMEAYLILAGQMLDTKADKVSSATNGNLAGLNGSGNLTDSGWNGAKDTTSISGNPISISGLKSNQLAKNPIITFEPIQDLHGQSKPYPAGGGKNKLNLTIEALKQNNIGGTWSGNTYSFRGIVYTVLTDNAGNVIGINANGTNNTGNHSFFYAYANLPAGSYKVAGCPSGGSSSTWIIYTSVGVNDYGSGATFTLSSATLIETRCWVYNGATISNKVFYPMIYDASIGDATFAPYENICPISGYDKIEALSCGVNVWDEQWKTGAYKTEDGTWVENTSRICSKNLIPVIPNATYFVPTISGNSICDIFYYGNNKQYVGYKTSREASNFSFTTPNNCYYINFGLWTDYGGTYNNNVSINYPATQTSYVASNKATSISESLGQTSFGGKLDVRQGDYADGYFEVDLGDLNWSYRTEASVSGKNVFSSTNMTAYKNGGEVNAVCSGYNYAGLVGGLADMANKNNFDICVLATNGSNYVIYLRDSRYTDASQLKTALSGVKLVIERQSANHIQLTPREISLLKDYAYVSTNGTSIALDYHNGEMASLADVSQLGETVNLIGNGMLKHQRIKHVFGNVTANNFYDYNMTGEYENLTWPNVVSITMTTPEGNIFDHKGVLLYRPGSNKVNIVIEYQCGSTATNVFIYIDVLYL